MVCAAGVLRRHRSAWAAGVLELPHGRPDGFPPSMLRPPPFQTPPPHCAHPQGMTPPTPLDPPCLADRLLCPLIISARPAPHPTTAQFSLFMAPLPALILLCLNRNHMFFRYNSFSHLYPARRPDPIAILLFKLPIPSRFEEFCHELLASQVMLQSYCSNFATSAASICCKHLHVELGMACNITLYWYNNRKLLSSVYNLLRSLTAAVLQQVDEAVPLLVAQDKNPAFHKVVSGLKAVHPPRNPVGLRVQPANLTKPKQETAPVQQVSPA